MPARTNFNCLWNHLGSTANVFNATTNQVAASYRYDVWGVLRDTAPLSTNNNRRTFTGQAFDQESGLYCFGNGTRYLDPTLGQFTQKDPVYGEISDPRSLNPCSYAFGNPVWYRDPSGLETEEQPQTSLPTDLQVQPLPPQKISTGQTAENVDITIIFEDDVEHGQLGNPHEFNVKGYSAQEAHNPVPSTGNQRGSTNGTGFTPVKGGSFPPGQRLPLPPLVDRSRYAATDSFFNISLDNSGILDQTRETIQQVFDLWEFQYGVSPRSALYDIWQGFGGAFKGLLIFGHDIVTDPIGTNEQIQRNKIKYYQNLWQSVTHPSQTIQNTFLEWRTRGESGAYQTLFNGIGNLAAQAVIGKVVGAPFKEGSLSSILSEEVPKVENELFNIFRSDADPLRTKHGPARFSYPKEFERILNELTEAGVEIDFRLGALGYSPQTGGPGKFIFDPEGSIGALRHEFRHFQDIRDAGYPGFRPYFEDPNAFWRLEYRGYMEEIRFARSQRDFETGHAIVTIMRTRRVEILGEK